MRPTVVDEEVRRAAAIQTGQFSPPALPGHHLGRSGRELVRLPNNICPGLQGTIQVVGGPRGSLGEGLQEFAVCGDSEIEYGYPICRLEIVPQSDPAESTSFSLVVGKSRMLGVACIGPPSLMATVDFESEEAVDYPLFCLIRPLSATPQPAAAIDKFELERREESFGGAVKRPWLWISIRRPQLL